MPVQLLKVHSLTGCIDLARMRRAFKAVKRDRGAAGVDKVDIQAFEANLDDNLADLMFDLKHEGCYRPAPLRRVYIPKGEGKLRPLGIPPSETGSLKKWFARFSNLSLSRTSLSSLLASVLAVMLTRRLRLSARLTPPGSIGSWTPTSRLSSITSPMT